jgi:allantoinase
MILKNCYIYDELDDQEKNVDILFEEKIIEYRQNISSEFEKKSEAHNFKLSTLTKEDIQFINENQAICLIDAEGMLTIPGGIDPHVHFDTPGFTHREDFYHGSMAAAAGGITTVIDMPCTSIPPVTNGKNFDFKLNAIMNSSCVDFALFGGLDANNFEKYEEHMEELADRGVKGFKTYFISGMISYPRVDKYQFYKILQKGKELNSPILLHAEDYELLHGLEKELSNQPDDYMRYFKTRPALGEILAVSNALEIAKSVNGNLHIVHVASSEAAELINHKIHDYNISYETCPHYLYFTYEDFKTKGSSLKTAPVVKAKFDREKLWQFLAEGKCSFVSSDHAPSTLSEKNTGSFQKDYGGIPGTQTLIPVIFSEGYKKNKISLKKLIEVISKNAAKRYNIYPQKGTIQKNSDADFVIIDQDKEWTFQKKLLYSKGETTPFDGEKFNGKVLMTILRGKIIYQEKSGLTIEKGYGKYV